MGTLTVGFRLDNNLAAQFKRATESDIAFAVDGHIRASTLPAGDRAQLASLLKTGGVQTVSLANGEYVALKRPLAPAAASAGGKRRAERAAAPLAHRAAAISRRHPHRPRRRGDDRRAGGDDSQLRCCADDYQAAGDDYRRDAGDVGDRRPDAEDRAEPRGELGRRGRQAARRDVQHAHRLDRPLPARGRAARAAVGAGTTVDRHRARDSEPADDHQGVAAHAGQRAREPRRDLAGADRRRRRGRAPQPGRQRRARFRPADPVRLRAGRRQCVVRRCGTGDAGGPPGHACDDHSRIRRSSRSSRTPSACAWRS